MIQTFKTKEENIMRCFTVTPILLMLLGLLITIGCSGQKAPTIPGDPSRTAEDFKNSWILWQGLGGAKYQEVDLAVLVYGPNPPFGKYVDYPVETEGLLVDKHWTIATSVEKIADGAQSIKYAWLDDVSNPVGGPAMASSFLYTVDGDDYEIGAAKVAACYFSHYGNTDTIEVATAFMQRELDGDNLDWEIGVVRTVWPALDFPNCVGSTSELIIFDDEDHADDVDDSDDYHPDIAYDPTTGDIHVVWTGASNLADHPYRLNYKHYDYDASTWDDQVMIYEEDKDYAAWAPRIAIGNAGGGLGETVGIVYSSFSRLDDHYAKDHWHVGGAYWNVDTEYPDDAGFLHFSYDATEDAGFPRLDMAPRECPVEDACASIVFEQFVEWDDVHPIFHVIEINNVRDAYWVIDIDDDRDEGFFGAVSIHYPDEEPEASLSFFHQVQEGIWLVRAGRFELGDDTPEPDWLLIAGAVMTGTLNYDDFVDFLQTETFQAGDIVTINAFDRDNAYWLGFCNKIDSDADSVNVAYGDTVPL